MTTVRDERGETLVELLITVMVIAIGVVAVVAALSSSIIASDTHHELSQGEVVVRDYGEAIKRKAIDASAFTKCPTKAQLTPSAAELTAFGFALPSGWSNPTVNSVEYWVPDKANFPNGTWSAKDNATTCNSYYSSCFNNTGAPCDAGLQRVTYTITNTRTNYASTSVTARVIVRRNNAS